MKRLLPLLVLLSTGAIASPATFADRLAAQVQAVRLDCPAGESTDAECALADMSRDTVRALLSIGSGLTPPWRRDANGIDRSAADDGGQQLVVTLKELERFKTLIVVRALSTPAEAVNSPTPAAIYALVSMLVRLGGTAEQPTVSRLGQTAPAFFRNGEPMVPLTSLEALGCKVTPIGTALVRVSCEYPNVGVLYVDTPRITR